MYKATLKASRRSVTLKQPAYAGCLLRLEMDEVKDHGPGLTRHHLRCYSPWPAWLYRGLEILKFQAHLYKDLYFLTCSSCSQDFHLGLIDNELVHGCHRCAYMRQRKHPSHKLFPHKTLMLARPIQLQICIFQTQSFLLTSKHIAEAPRCRALGVPGALSFNSPAIRKPRQPVPKAR